MTFNNNQKDRNQQPSHRINHQIRASQVRLIGPDGSNLGVVSLNDALRQASSLDLDLVEINGKSSPVICKITDLGKLKYEEKKKASEQRKNQKIQELKEIMFRPSTEENDLNHKLESAKGFLSDGNKVKFTVKFRGREIQHPEIGEEKMLWVLEQLKEFIMPLQEDQSFLMEGKFMSLIVSPAKKN